VLKVEEAQKINLSIKIDKKKLARSGKLHTNSKTEKEIVSSSHYDEELHLQYFNP